MIKKIIGSAVFVVVMFAVFPMVFGIIPWAWLKFAVFALWVLILVGQMSYILFHGIQSDIEDIRNGRDIITGKPFKK
jgi:glucan phosphoethanolaminetransferase (alkaline phosphatase superfamily)